MIPVRSLMKSRRGVSLIELVIALGIMVTAVAISSILFLEGARLTRRGEEIVIANDAARVAGEAIISKVQLAGMFAPGGMWVIRGGTPVLINTVYGTDSTDGGTDDLWIVTPDRNAMREPCVDVGASTLIVIPTPITAALEVNCVASLASATMLMATNMETAALLTPPFTFTAPSGATGGTIGYAEFSVAGFAPTLGQGFKDGDQVYPVTILHYFTEVGANGVRNLMQENGSLNPSNTGEPLVPAGGRVLIQQNIGDLQVAFGVDSTTGPANPKNILFAAGGRGSAYTAGLRSLRVSVVALSQRAILDSSGQPMKTTEFKPMTVEGSTPTGAADGKRRTLFSRRVELPNMAPGSL